MRSPAILRAVGLSIGIAVAGTAAAQAQAAPASASESAPGAEEVARNHFQLGRSQYESGAFRDAAASFEHAYELSHREVLWYNIYLAYRDAGDNPKAALALRN